MSKATLGEICSEGFSLPGGERVDLRGVHF